MANEIQVDYSSGNTLYVVIRNQAGQAWCPTAGAFENWGACGHTADDYDITLADVSGSHYVGSVDGDISAGSYCVQIFRQLGVNPADTDTLVSSRPILWTGSGELTATKIVANKGVMDKATGHYTYYDDDGQTVLLTHTVLDTRDYLTRTPN